MVKPSYIDYCTIGLVKSSPYGSAVVPSGCDEPAVPPRRYCLYPTYCLRECTSVSPIISNESLIRPPSLVVYLTIGAALCLLC